MSAVSPVPRITLVIPTLNEFKNIDQALQCVVENGISRDDMEVLLVDGGSSDRTVQIAQTFTDCLQLRVIVVQGCTVYRALNIGLGEARGVFFVRVDARSKIPNNYINTCLRHLGETGVMCAGGIQLQYGVSRVGDSIARVTSSVIGTGGAKFRTSTESGFVDSVYLGAYRTETLRELGGFEDNSDFVSEDALVNKRIREQGGKIYLDASLMVLYPAKDTFRALVKQYVIYGAGKAFVFKKHHKFTSIRQLIPLIFLLAWFLLGILCIVGVIPWFVGLLALFVYLVIVTLTNASSSGLGGQRSGTLWGRTLATICIHFTWPFGFFLFLINSRLHKRLVRWL